MSTKDTPQPETTEPGPQIGPITLPPLTEEQQEYLDGIIAADMTPGQIEQCTCVFGGPEPLDKKKCPIHDQ